jgi:hypothetical protein
MHSDAFFRIGSTHSICQDYAAAGRAAGTVCAFVSDGCSGSPDNGEPGAPFTDFGARFLVRSAFHYLARGGDAWPVYPELILASAEQMINSARLPSSALDATLLMAYPDQNVIRVVQTGDGVIAGRRKDGSLFYESLEFSGNAPRYLSYDLTPTKREAFEREGQTLTAERGFRGTNGEWLPADRLVVPTTQARLSEFHLNDWDLVLLFSDGAMSLCTPQGLAVPISEVLDQIFDFKGYAGKFISRRCGTFFSRFCVERGWKNTDDFSCAGIYCGDGP